MKQLITILLISCSNILFGQTTAIPDANFELALILSGYDTGSPDGSIPTANINTITSLDISGLQISNLTGIQDFIALTTLNCAGNQLSSLDVSQNTDLTILKCHSNQLTSLDVNQNTVLTELWCQSNQLTSLDVSQNTTLIFLLCYINQLTNIDVTQNAALIYLICYNNQLTTLDVTYNINLELLHCESNNLTCLNVKNNNNTNITFYSTINNPNLSCTEVDNVAYSNANWTSIDSQVSFSTNCPTQCLVGIDELTPSNISIYPNPTSGNLTISLKEISTGVLSIRNYLGQKIKQEEFNNTHELNLNLDGPAGIYFLRIEIDERTITKKIVKE